MKSAFFLTLACLVVYVSAHGYEIHYNQTFLGIKPGKTFFKIVLFSDLHYANGANSSCRDLSRKLSRFPCSDLNTTSLQDSILNIENPDLVIFMGDNIDGRYTLDHEKSLRAILAPVDKYKIPHAVILGEHDDENDETPDAENLRYQIIKWDRQNPYSISKFGLAGVAGVGNYGHGVLDKDGNPTHHLYFVDSSSYDSTGIGGYDFIKASQTNWYNLTSYNRTADLNKTLPGLIFHHIPGPQHELAWHCNKGKDYKPITYTGFGTPLLPDGFVTASGTGLFAGYESCSPDKTVDRCVGRKQEGVNSSRVDSGLFATILDRNEIKMVNVAHDHLNSFCCPLGHSGIQHCYSGATGYQGYGKPGYSRRARVIRLFPNGKIDTYFRLDKYSNPAFKQEHYQVIYNP